MYSYLREVTLPGGEYVVRNFVGVIEDIGPEASTVETDLFPRGALEYYSKKNMGWDYTPEEYDTWQLPERGGAQGDYRDGVSGHRHVCLLRSFVVTDSNRHYYHVIRSMMEKHNTI
jgi:hypothetical protein